MKLSRRDADPVVEARTKGCQLYLVNFTLSTFPCELLANRAGSGGADQRVSTLPCQVYPVIFTLSTLACQLFHVNCSQIGPVVEALTKGRGAAYRIIDTIDREVLFSSSLLSLQVVEGS